MRLYGERGRVGGADGDKHQDDRGESIAPKILLLFRLVWRDALKTSIPSGGRRPLRPSTHTQSKYRQMHRPGGQGGKPPNIGSLSRGQTPKHRVTVQDTRGSMAPAASQSYGRTAGDNRRYWGGATNKRKTDGEEARGRERDARMGKLSGDMEFGGGNLVGGREGGTRAISGT